MHTDQEINNLINENDFFKIGNEDVLGESLPVFINRPRNLAKFLGRLIKTGSDSPNTSSLPILKKSFSLIRLLIS